MKHRRSTSLERVSLLTYALKPLATLLPLVLVSTGCSTKRYLKAFGDRRMPERVVAAKVSSEKQLYAKILYKNGVARVVTVTIPDDLQRRNRHDILYAKKICRNFDQIDGQEIALLAEDAERARHSWGVEEAICGMHFDLRHDGHVCQIWASGTGPINWLSLDPYLTFLFVPLPVVFDVVTAPIQVAIASLHP